MCRGVSAVEVSCAALGSGQLSQGPHSAPPQGYPCKTWNLGLTEEEGGGPEPKKKMERGAGYGCSHFNLEHHKATAKKINVPICTSSKHKHELIVFSK